VLEHYSPVQRAQFRLVASSFWGNADV